MATTYDFTENNNIELLKDSTQASQIKLDLIRKAKHHIHIASYFLDNSSYPKELYKELIKAHQRGVEVRIIATYIPTLTKDIFFKTQSILNIKDGGPTFSYLLLHPYGNLTAIHNIHEKILIVDGLVAVMGGRNFSNSSFKAKDLEAKIEGGMTLQIQDHFQKLFNLVVDQKIKYGCKPRSANEDSALDDVESEADCIARHESMRFSLGDKQYFPLPINPGKIKGRLLSHNALQAQIDKKMNLNERRKMNDDIIDAVVANKDFKTMRAYNYYILPTEKYLNFLSDSIKENKDVKIITNSLKTAGIVSNKGYLFSLPIFYKMIQQGMQIYQWQGPLNLDYLHEKVIIFDENHIFLGSHNFGVGSTAVSNEICIEFFSDDMGKNLAEIFDEEISNQKKAIKANNLQLALEIKNNLSMINFLIKHKIGKILEQTY